MKNNKLPELLCPAGSPRALEAAIDAGADAVYLGASGFNARLGAANFTYEELNDAVKLAHAYGVKIYLTLNTLFFDREASEFLKAAENAYIAGVDALITADIGGASLINRYIKDFPLHASTQMAVHNLGSANLLQNSGFSRVVLARELPLCDIEYFTENSPIEAEIFVHGALCVCHSGQCLFSSLVGGRSGNRGECAQPCRLPYYVNGKEKYPLSLKDYCLASHINELISSGVASLKIEGRMKSPEYVKSTAEIYRRLLDERRNATNDEINTLSEIFSRSGFTDAYFTGKISSAMLGVRSISDKQNSRELDIFKKIQQKIPLKMKAMFKADKPSLLEIECGDKIVTMCGDIPRKAINAPLDAETVTRNLTKLGSTPFFAENITGELDENLMLPISAINKLRRDATDILTQTSREYVYQNYIPTKAKYKNSRQNTARFYKAEQITKSAREYFDIIYLPVEEFMPDSVADGVIIPPVILDHERDTFITALEKAVSNGAKHALCGNLGHIEFVKSTSLIMHGDLRLNVTNSETSAKLSEYGFEDIILSPELSLPQARDITGNTALVVYGRIPLMTLEKCVSLEISDCETCQRDSVILNDRKNINFPVLREWQHRNVIYNSVPTYMADQQNKLTAANITNRHFIFTTETKAEVDNIIEAYKKSFSAQTALGSDKIKRI